MPSSFHDNRRGGGGYRSGGGGGGGRRRNHMDNTTTNNLPLEQGIICSLKDSFGFIHCAERPEEVFFHYSQVVNCHPDELDIDTEVEFRVSSSSSPANNNNNTAEDDGSSSSQSRKRTTALAVSTLPSGTVVWETEEEPEKVHQGLVERPIPRASDSRRKNNGGGGAAAVAASQEGSIQVLLPDPSATTNNTTTTTSTTDDESSLATTTKKGPLVRFRPEDVILPDNNHNNNNHKTPRLFRGDFVEFRVFLDRRTKQQYARHIVLVQTEKERTRAEKERQLMKSAIQEEGMVISLCNGYGFLKTNRRVEHVYFHYSHLIVPHNDDDDEEEEFELKKGQEMKFWVVTEMVDGQAKCAARQCECLPQGSVQFHTVLARGVKGTVTMCPRPPSAGNDRGYADDKNGSIRLLEPIVDTDAKDANGTAAEVLITEVSLEFNDSPGGVYTFQQRGTPTNGLWILEGDVLLFDVVKELADGSYQAAPTHHTLAIGGTIEDPPQAESTTSSGACIRLVACSLVSRAEGTMHTLKEQGGYGFISFAERPVDAHFSTYNIMPEELASDLRKQLGYPGEAIRPEVGVGAHFDICAHGTVHAMGGSRGGGGGNNRRGGGGGSVHERENVKAHRILLLPPSAVPMTKTLAHGAKGVVKAVDAKQLYAGFIGLDDEIIVMTLEERHPLVAQMIDSFIQESAEPHGRKQIVYKDVLSVKDDEVVVEMLQTKAAGILAYDHIPVAGGRPNTGRLIIKRVEQSSDNDPMQVETAEDASLKKNGKTIPEKGIRFDKASLSDETRNDLPPNAGDVVLCDVIQNRRTGKLGIENLKILERNELGAEAAALAAAEHRNSPGVGVVQNVVPKSNFGFISVLDKKAVRQELLFFSLKKDDNIEMTDFRKGDEVKFDIGIDPKSGKRMAQNVERLPKGTIPSKPSKNACSGIILMEPTHTSLSDKPLRKKNSNDSSGGRWATTKEDPHKVQAGINERGVILLLDDKSGMFRKRQTRRKRSGSVDSHDSDDDKSIGDASTDNESLADDRSIDSAKSSDGSQTGAILSHLTYKNGAIAIHGAGAVGGMDSNSNPKRGDIVTFSKARKGMKVQDIRINRRKAAEFLTGRLENIKVEDTGDVKKNAGSATFIAATEEETRYEVDLREIVSCDATLLKEKQQVEGILHDGAIYGVCRTSDLYLESKLGKSHKERPRLNLSVKKDRGGKIIAQSSMAKGPDGTIGFAEGWTTRISQFTTPLSTAVETPDT